MSDPIKLRLHDLKLRGPGGAYVRVRRTRDVDPHSPTEKQRQLMSEVVRIVCLALFDDLDEMEITCFGPTREGGA